LTRLSLGGQFTHQASNFFEGSAVMRPGDALRGGLFALGLLALLGCQKLNKETTLSLEPGETKVYHIDGPRSEQKVNVVATSAGAPVDVYVILSDTPDAAAKLAEEKSLASGGKLSDALASKPQAEEASLDVTIPAKKPFAVLVVNPINARKKTDVKLKVTGK
jgi:hypothetical protein